MKRFGLTVLFTTLLAAMPFAQSAPAPEVFGEWEMTTVSPVGENTNTVEFRKDGEVVKALAKSPQGERPYDSVAVDGNKVTLVLTIDFQGQPMTITYMGTLADNQINGSADFGGLAQGSFSAKKKDAAAK
ncbi:MAG: hypothetical protein JSU08_09685 [Acidobacteria bacterium]|nr:hypothetical protein [Acidobacteriota bacterium]